jgi:formate dehydrogenase subunit delta
MSDQLATLTRMLKQIALNNGAYETEEAATRVCEHIKRFWAPSMKKNLLEHLDSIQSELGPVEQIAVKQLQEIYG